ncbi:MAG: hypothetical protein ACYST0_00955 [Planctomycetota bacterium]|jgi:hypothetical protein
MAPTRGGRDFGRRLAAGSFIVLAIVLPALLAFTNITAPPADGEKQRIAAAMPPASKILETPLGFFYGLTMPEDAAEQWVANPEQVVVQVRRAGLLALLVISGLLYFLVALVRGRAAAVLSCLSLCLVPAVVGEGHVLRPEQAATMFGLLGVLLVHLYPDALRRRRSPRRRGGGPLQRWLNLGGIVMCVSLCYGVAMACMPLAGIYLLVPGGALLLVALCLAAVFPRVVRRRSLWRWPNRAATMRFVPWIVMCLGNLALGYVVLTLTPGVPAMASVSEAGMLSGSWYLLVPALVLIVVGGARMVLVVGLKLGRQGHVRPDALLLIYAAVIVLHHLSGVGGPRDHLPAAPALAVLMGDGAAILLFLLVGRLAGGRPRS